MTGPRHAHRREPGRLRADALSLIDLDGHHLSGAKPSKEAFLHAAVYRARPDAGAVVHLHSTHAVAVSCLADIDPHQRDAPADRLLRHARRRLPLLAYHAPGDESLEALAESRPPPATAASCWPTTGQSPPELTWQRPRMLPKSSRKQPACS